MAPAIQEISKMEWNMDQVDGGENHRAKLTSMRVAILKIKNME